MSDDDKPVFQDKQDLDESSEHNKSCGPIR